VSEKGLYTDREESTASPREFNKLNYNELRILNPEDWKQRKL